MMKKPLLHLRTALLRIRQRIRWGRQIARYPAVAAMPASFPADASFLVIAPHADDELIGCYPFLKTVHAFVFLCSLTGTDPSPENKERREGEFDRFCRSLHMPYTIAGDDWAQDLSTCIEQMKPTCVLLPSVVDWHKEHRLVNRVFQTLKSKVPTVIWYQVSVPISRQYINMTSLMSPAEQKEKWYLFATFYSSQRHINIDRFRFVERHTVRDAIALPFVVMSYRDWCQAMERLPLIEEDVSHLQDRINDLAAVYRQSDHDYNLLYSERTNHYDAL